MSNSSGVKNFNVAYNLNKIDKTVTQNANNTVDQLIKQVDVDTFDFDEFDDLTELNVPKGDWIFGEEAKSTEQFGGSQGRLIANFENLFSNDPIIKEIVSKYYSDVSIEDLELLFTKMDDTGCGYIAAINTLFSDYAIKSPEEFYKHFGFYPTIERNNKNLDKKVTFYNYDYLFLDFFLYHAKTKGFTKIEDVYGNIDELIDLENQGKDISIEETGMGGTYEIEVANLFADYLKEKGIDLKVTKNDQPLDVNTINKILRDGDQIVIGGESFDLYEPKDVNNNNVLDDISMEDVEPHTMYLVGTTGDPDKVVVSSWGEEYIMNIEDITDAVIYSYN